MDNNFKATKIKPLICGISGPVLTEEEKNFLAKVNPLGFVVFKKNLLNKEQALMLTNSLREAIGNREVPILIDQEGGSVLRLREDHWRQPPSPLELGKFAYMNGDKNIEKTERLVYLNSLLIGYEMKEIGVNVNCAPVADLLVSGAHHITSTRSFGPDSYITSKLVNAMALGMIDSGVVPIIKHMMGQGRAKRDSHFELPIVEDSLKILEGNDFNVFASANQIPWGMPAHIIYKELDPDNIATYSQKIVNYIRNNLNFKGILISDCLTMKALEEDWEEKAIKALNAGLDLLLYGSCKHEVISEITSNIENISATNWNRIKNSLEAKPKEINFSEVKLEFEELLVELESELEKSRVSENLQFILKIIESRKMKDADFSSPLYRA